MNAEFQWWLLIVGLVVGGALVYLVLADLRAEADLVDDQDRGQDPELGGPPGSAPGGFGDRGSDDGPDVKRDRP